MKPILFLAGAVLLAAACSGPGNNPANSAESPDRTGALAPRPSAATPDTTLIDASRTGDTSQTNGDLSP